MATFAKPTFSAASYAAFRPTYPAKLYNTILSYHQGSRRLCLDLGCGPGIVTREMSHHFDRIIGIDPSAGMIKQARESIKDDQQFAHVEFREGPGESLDFIGDGEVDMVTVGQAVHWFDFDRFWAEMKRVLRPQGTLACWGYKDHVFVDFPAASEIMYSYSNGSDAEKLGPYWPMPGRGYLREQLRILQPPTSDWEQVQRLEYEPGVAGRHSGEGMLLMERTLTIAECKEYLRTWSSFHGWHEVHPEQKAKSKGGEGDVVDRMFDEMSEETEWFRDETNPVDVEWGSALILARRRG